MIDVIDSLEDEVVAAALGCSAAHLNELAGKGEVPAFKIGRSWRYSAAAINEFLKLRALANVMLEVPGAQAHGGRPDLTNVVRVVASN